MIRNPILPGFHPDPSVVRAGDDYYIATSTFEWLPGVRIHHSRDLVHWRPLDGALKTLDLAGVPDSGGVWAPDLTYHDGWFYLVYSVVDNYAYGYLDVSNYLVTAPSVTGPWSAPAPLPGRGFDMSLFHDPGTGRTWMLNMVCDDHPDSRFGGIELTELTDGKPSGPPELIFRGTATGVTEGPHLLRHGEWYYLVVAEGGTGYEHGVTVARSRSPHGPYEVDPAGPMLTARNDPALPLQKAGHGCLVQTRAGEWYMTYLAARPYTPRGRCVLGRETCLARVEWRDGWPRLPDAAPALDVPPPALPVQAYDGPLDTWSTLRKPASPDWVTAADGWLRIAGGQSPHGLRSPSLVARPVSSRDDSLETVVEFDPAGTQCSAGITVYYNTCNWHYLAVTAAGLTVATSDRGVRTLREPVPVPPGPARLRAQLDGQVLRFSYDTGSGWRTFPYELDATVTSDENADEIIDGVVRRFGFTGAMIGFWVIDRTGEGAVARFRTDANPA